MPKVYPTCFQHIIGELQQVMVRTINWVKYCFHLGFSYSEHIPFVFSYDEQHRFHFGVGYSEQHWVIKGLGMSSRVCATGPSSTDENLFDLELNVIITAAPFRDHPEIKSLKLCALHCCLPLVHPLASHPSRNLPSL